MTVLIRARIIADESPSSPREDCNIGTFVMTDRGMNRYGFADRAMTSDEAIAAEHGGFAGLVKHLERQYGATRVFPVGMLDHSGVHILIGGGSHWSDSAGWDSGTCGFVFDTAAGREVTGVQHSSYGHNAHGGDVDNVTAALTAEIETLDQWLRGDVYGYVIEHRTLCALCEAQYRAEDDETPEAPDECPHCAIEDDSCWGFYGADPRENGMAGYLDEHAKVAIIAEYEAEHVEWHGARIEAEWREIAAA